MNDLKLKASKRCVGFVQGEGLVIYVYKTDDKVIDVDTKSWDVWFACQVQIFNLLFIWKVRDDHAHVCCTLFERLNAYKQPCACVNAFHTNDMNVKVWIGLINLPS